MRTSRISRDTARVVRALSPSQRRTTRQSLRAFAHSPGLPQENGTTAPSSHSPANGKSEDDSRPPGKRKRSASDTSADAHPSPSKAVKREGGATRKPRRQPAKRITGPNGAVQVSAPTNWEAMYDTAAAIRRRVPAPVDTMGCESLAEAHRSPRDRRLQTLVSLMLSSQTKDTVTAVAMRDLQEQLPGGFDLEGLLRVDPAELNRLIGKVGFHNNKTRFIKAAAAILRDSHGGDIPDSIEGLVALPGVGPKMAYLCMSAAWGRDEGIGVDVHVHRITNLWGWHKTATPEQTRAELESWLPRDRWHAINHLLVGLGQTVCLPVGRKCGECDLAAERLCPGAVARGPVKKKKKEVEVEVEVGEKGEVVVQVDDVGVKVEADLVDEGAVEVQAVAGTGVVDDA